MRTIIKKVYNENGIETGSMLTALVDITSNHELKLDIENHLRQYAFEILYPRQSLKTYSEVNRDTPSIVVIRNFNELSEEELNI